MKRSTSCGGIDFGSLQAIAISSQQRSSASVSLSQGHINNNIPIITQVTPGNYQPGQGQGQVRVEIYPPAQTCWREIRGFLHKEMNLRIKSSFYDALTNNEIYPAWTIAFQSP